MAMGCEIFSPIWRTASVLSELRIARDREIAEVRAAVGSFATDGDSARWTITRIQAQYRVLRALREPNLEEQWFSTKPFASVELEDRYRFPWGQGEAQVTRVSAVSGEGPWGTKENSEVYYRFSDGREGVLSAQDFSQGFKLDNGFLL